MPIQQQYPNPVIPFKPVVSGRTFGTGRTRTASVFDATLCFQTFSDSGAIVLALKELGLTQGDAILVPSYHSSELINAMQWLGVVPFFYRLLDDLSVDFSHLDHLLQRMPKALITTHYFGFSQPIKHLRSWCDNHAVSLIEDCSQAFYGAVDNIHLGAFGDYSVASARNFFPVDDGGLLVLNKKPTLDHSSLTSIDMKCESKVFSSTVEQSLAYGRLGLLRPFFKFFAKYKQTKDHQGTQQQNVPNTCITEKFDPNWMEKSISMVSETIIEYTNTKRVVAKRRQYYLTLLRAFSGMQGVKPLHTDLPDGVVPYVFPLLIASPQHAIHKLRTMGVPFSRWSRLSTNDEDGSCAVSARMSKHLLQLPCHQELTHKEIDWLVSKVKLACTCDSIDLPMTHSEVPTEAIIDVKQIAGEYTSPDVNATLALSTENKADHKSNAFS